MTDEAPHPGTKLVNNAIITLLSRGAILLATGIGLPAAGFMINRGITAVDDISKKIDTVKDNAIEMNGTVKVIQQTQAVQSQILADHETRVRILERAGMILPPRPNP